MATRAAGYGSMSSWANARERLDRYQIGRRWIRPGAPRSVAVAVSHGLNGNAGEMRSLSRVRRRIRDDGQPHVPIFHPNNGMNHGNRSPRAHTDSVPIVTIGQNCSAVQVM